MKLFPCLFVSTIYEVRGIGAPYHLFLPESEQELVSLSEEIPLQYTVLEGKYLDGSLFTGSLVTLSAKGGEVHSDHSVAPWSNIKMQLLASNGKDILGELYAKVIGSLGVEFGEVLALPTISFCPKANKSLSPCPRRFRSSTLFWRENIWMAACSQEA